ncbi:hypothetical protein K3N28_00760 [Glycomyces sp. TRM65418]|uniref:hypothetical protein n=1 Tax=Glycomyces sp. TRM65418 TaxID=2867006 RepID=UPI001CE58845|nr:hypothetical protein [Glycomyces sp. TRM65418]MCC3761605.1 hypothetical protein [Glycomyces sp. TRM65418]QZD55701.1 hypothetical protein K3N28_00750 [Glycomyces sp. TRM65418]
MDFLGMNPDSANANGEQIMTLAESFGSLQGELMSIVEGCIAAAGEPEVIGGYEEFGATWSTDLARTAAHGASVGGTTLITVADGVGVDAENAALQAVDAPDVAPPAIAMN